MTKQAEKQNTDLEKPLTGSNVAPKGHGIGCPCCEVDDSFDEDED